MKDIFQQVQDSFMELGIILSGVDLEHDLKNDEINEITSSLLETYRLFEQGLCETAYMCDKCSHNKEQLHNLLEMMKSCAKTGRIDRVSNVALVEFMYIIPQVLSELRTVYLEDFQKRKIEESF